MEEKKKEPLDIQCRKGISGRRRTAGRGVQLVQTSSDGPDSAEVARQQSLYGKNEMEHERRENPLTMSIKAFINPFIGVLTGLVVLSYLLDIYLAEPAEQDWRAIIFFSTIVVLSVILRF